jgi:2'-5' RNA ligase
MSENGQGTGYSLWLLPEPEERARLEALIERLSSRLGTVPFTPHVTLLGGLQGAEEWLVDRMHELVRDLPPLTLRLTRTDGQDAFFRCFYVEVEGAAALDVSHARAVAHLGVRTPPPFFPHLSLVYGRLSLAQKQGLAGELRPAVEGRVVRFTELRLVQTDGHVTDWVTVGQVFLTG